VKYPDFHASRFILHVKPALSTCFKEISDMAKPKYDGVIQAVRYGEDGQVLWVRAFLRRGPTWSDIILLDRRTLVEQLKSGVRFYAGERVPLLAGTFEVSAPVKLIPADGQEVLVTGDLRAEKDCLEGVPLV
jgi:hypothetical protein